MESYIVAVRNELTGEIRSLEILALFQVDAQVEALTYMFRTEGWRKAVASVAIPQVEEQSA